MKKNKFRCLESTQYFPQRNSFIFNLLPLPSGEFFKDESNFKEMIDKMIHNIDKYEPRQFFVSNYGILKTGKKLKQFINEVYGDTLNVPMDKIDYITPEFQKKNYIECSLK